MNLLEVIYGTTIVASWLNLVLYTIELVLALRYLTSYGIHGPRRFNLVVYLLAVNGMLATVSNCAVSWQYMVQSPGILPAVHTWPLSATMFSNLVAATTEQIFLVHRFYVLSGKLYLSASVLILILAHTSVTMVTAIDLLVHPFYGHPLCIITMTVGFCISAAIDVVIPLLLVGDLRKIQTSSMWTQGLIRRICLHSLSTGGAVAVTEVLVIVLFWLQSPYLQVFTAALGRLYGLTIFVNLLVCQRSTNSAIAERTITGDLTTSVGIDTSQTGHTGNLTSMFEHKNSLLSHPHSDLGRSTSTTDSIRASKEGIFICSTDHTASSAC
ncbi:hypothetical protein BDN72DRAFT_82792 [Pluteus cervinus]|uniref:Uncharacterized protein n=1 Tax=Pluteus cervinus TaxID=181527 RepID=A0ACD3APZ6_9AGAR|nr:hypothetical protein BDN72DRAFT_82792 [Pluteus cervinus]